MARTEKHPMNRDLFMTAPDNLADAVQAPFQPAVLRVDKFTVPPQALRPFLNLPSPPILQPVGPAICAGAAPLARAVLADGQNPTLPCLMAGDVGRGFEAQQSRKNPHERDHGDRAIGAFSGGMSGADFMAM